MVPLAFSSLTIFRLDSMATSDLHAFDIESAARTAMMYSSISLTVDAFEIGMTVLAIRCYPDVHVAAVPFLIADLFFHISVTQYAHANHK